MDAESHWKRSWAGDPARPPPMATEPHANGFAHPRPASFAPVATPNPHEIRLPPIQGADHDLSKPGVIPLTPFPGRDRKAARQQPRSPFSPKRPRLQNDQRPDIYRANPSADTVGRRNDGRSYTDAPHPPPFDHHPAPVAGQYAAPSQPHHYLGPGDHHPDFRPGLGNPDPVRQPSIQLAQCRYCGSLQPVVEELVSSLAELDLDLRGGSVGKAPDAPLVSQVGLHHSVEWAIRTVCDNRASARELKAHLLSCGSDLDNAEEWKRKVQVLEQERDQALRAVRSSDQARTSRRERASCSSASKEGRRISMPESHHSSHSPHRNLSNATTMFATSPSSAHPPSTGPSSASGKVAPPMSSSTTQALQSPQAAHFQDLQHQVSTKTLALQTLQQEHDNLLAALSRSQTRCSTFEKKFQMSDAEINNLTEDRMRLQSQVDAFEAQVDELVQSRDDARKQSVANGGQYMKIMEMASQLEAQGTTDKKKWKSEKDEWDNEREALNRRIADLEKENEMQINLLFAPKTSNSGQQGPPPQMITTTKTAKLTSPISDPKPPSNFISNSSSLTATPVTPAPAPAPASSASSPNPGATTATSNAAAPASTDSTSTTINSLFGRLSSGVAANNKKKTIENSGSSSSSTATTTIDTNNQNHNSKITSSNNGSPAISTGAGSDPSTTDPIMHSTSVPTLRGEIVHLRKCCQNMEIALSDIKSEGYRIDQLMQKFGNIGKRVVSKADGGTSDWRNSDRDGDESVKGGGVWGRSGEGIGVGIMMDGGVGGS
ncbi:MAG: hypothetical protein M1837_002773 [Sclerophora amabilis]|nr:MAG: hypothetical protein M1837_002773 [Sclerophora amabilis]